ncbi:MAG: hypothetical protein Q8N63_02900 [Nanoarchaeota archaeon]|nr:hypothetical protein [Nanoarchaeota archaeon]
MLEHINSLPPNQRQPPIAPRDFSTNFKRHYVLNAGNSKAIGDIDVNYVDRQEGANGDVFMERETVSITFDYPIGKTRRYPEFSVDNRNYEEIQGHDEVPGDILEVLADNLPLQVRRVLPNLPKK